MIGETPFGVPSGRKKVFVALSGGVDSSTATALLLQAGFDCAAVFMITFAAVRPRRNGSERGCQEQAGAEDVASLLRQVRSTARRLGIKLHVLDLRSDFEQIFECFYNEYRKGRTPNPCVVCNRLIKFGKLWDFAQRNGAQFFATGHYARVIKHNEQAGLYAGVDSAKDQSYALAMIDKKVLAHIILPMGDYTKEQTRKMAEEFGLGTEHKAESQEICFIPDDDYVAVLERRFPELVCEGDIVDSSGRILGKHNGIHRFTIGQRRGLRVAMGKPYYVVKIDAQTNTVTLGPKEEVMHRKLLASEVSWLIDEPASAFAAKVKIRYNDRGSQATVIPQGDKVIVEFDKPTAAITPGQLAVFYVQEREGDRVAGGGWIDKVAD
jgi:tRNA-specific 2-thiouridylase